MDIWIFGYLDIRIFGYLVIRIFGYLDIWICILKKIITSQYLKILFNNAYVNLRIFFKNHTFVVQFFGINLSIVLAIYVFFN